MKKILVYFILLNIQVFAQMDNDLDVSPRNIYFSNMFEKLCLVTITNNSTSTVSIDSIIYNSSILFVRNNDFSGFPVNIEPNSSISIDVQLSNYLVSEKDSNTVISIYNSSTTPIIRINVKVSSDMHNSMVGTVNGTVKDSNNYLSDAKLFFFYDGIYLIDSTNTDSNGEYEIELATGDYFISAQKDGYYLQYADYKNSPLEADFIYVTPDSVKTVNFILEPEIQTDLTIAGVVYSIATEEPIEEAIVVIRTGTHTPTKRAATSLDEPSRCYTVMTNSNGEFVVNNIMEEGDYYLEAFAQYYIPGYYNKMKSHETFWQNADSIHVFGMESGKDIYLDRDSSFGGGCAKGCVKLEDSESTFINDALIFAVSNSTQKIYNYNFSNPSGKFELSNLPSGTYHLITDRIGYQNSISNDFIISTTQTSVEDIVLVLLPTTLVKDNFQKIQNFDLGQNYPNPFNPSTNINFTIPVNDKVVISIYNVLGQKVAELFNSYINAGTYKIKFDASNLSSGIYIYQLKSSTKVLAKKMELLK